LEPEVLPIKPYYFPAGSTVWKLTWRFNKTWSNKAHHILRHIIIQDMVMSIRDVNYRSKFHIRFVSNIITQSPPMLSHFPSLATQLPWGNNRNVITYGGGYD
jgi:hypothetical protein